MQINFYAILCIKFVHEVQYSTSKYNIPLSALVVRKVTGGEIISKAMRKVPGNEYSAWRGGGGHQGKASSPRMSSRTAISGSINKMNNPVNIKLDLCSLQ